LDSQRPEVRIELEKVLRHFSESHVGKLVAETAKKGGRFIPERSVEALLTAIQPPLLVEGRFDLLFQLTNGDWILVDFKAEEEPSAGSYRDRIHRNQINAYAWLIERAIGIKVKSAFLAYVHPIASQREHTPDVYGFESNALRKLKSLLVEEEHGLEAIPSRGTKGICPVCPYGKSVGGPCEH
jgi:CRISPR/Cas system-associated exonuclease Cas4 (RecB family)